MMTAADAQDDLKEALRQHLKTIVDNSMSLVVDESSLDGALAKYEHGLRFIRVFYDKASTVITNEFSDG